MKKLIGAVCGAMFLLPLVTFAAVFRGAELYSLNSSEVLKDDLYAGGGTVNIASAVEGDVVAGGGNVMINSEISQDAIVAGGSVTILGSIGDDLRSGGGQIVVGSNVGDDAVLAGGSVHILKDATIGGDAILAGGSLIIEGTVLGGLRPKAESVVVNGTVKGDVEIWATKSINIGASAVINGKLTYHSPKEAVIEPGAKIAGEIKFDQTGMIPRVSKGAVLGILSIAFLIKLIAWLVAAYVLVRVLKTGSQNLVKHSLQSFWPLFGKGIVVAIVAPIVSIILFITVIGSMLGLLILLAFILLMILSGIYSGVIFGAWLWKYVFKQSDDYNSAAPVVIGVILLSLIGLIPVIGWIIYALFFLAAFGGIYNVVIHVLKKAE